MFRFSLIIGINQNIRLFATFNQYMKMLCGSTIHDLGYLEVYKAKVRFD